MYSIMSVPTTMVKNYSGVSFIGCRHSYTYITDLQSYWTLLLTIERCQPQVSSGIVRVGLNDHNSMVEIPGYILG